MDNAHMPSEQDAQGHTNTALRTLREGDVADREGVCCVHVVRQLLAAAAQEAAAV
jgi:hypothetical protein